MAPDNDNSLAPSSTPNGKTETYRVEDLTFSYPGRGMPALSGIDLMIGRGEFITLCGPSGCGKTTFLRHLKPSATPHGAKSGCVYFENSRIDELPARDAAARIGFVLQSPENQIVTDKVWHELAFGLESLGAKTPEIRLRVAEMASFFGIQTWFHKPVTELSGGQKQLLALASVMTLQPSALILDEPTSQLDPIAAGEFLTTVGKINRELGVTVILTEHRLEEAFPLSSRAVVMDEGRIIADGSPREVGLLLRGSSHSMFLAMPTPMRVWHAVQSVAEASGGREERIGPEEATGTPEAAGTPETTVAGDINKARYDKQFEVPLTVRDGAEWLARQNLAAPDNEHTKARMSSAASMAQEVHASLQTAVGLDGVWFKYAKDMPDVIKGLSFKARFGEITAILGGNGTGKTTTLSLIAGLLSPYRGKVEAFKYHDEVQIASRRGGALEGGEQVYALPQNPQTLFTAKTVREDLLEVLSERKLPKNTIAGRFDAMVKLCRLEGLLESHPYDLSGGEQQRAALAKVLLLQPRILLLDEPTKGLDAEFKLVFAAILRKLTAAGVAVIMASHDVEFCAAHADRCALFFDGGVVTENPPQAFFSGNSFYTTSANRMARGILPEAITAGDIIRALGGQAYQKRVPADTVLRERDLEKLSHASRDHVEQDHVEQDHVERDNLSRDHVELDPLSRDPLSGDRGVRELPEVDEVDAWFYHDDTQYAVKDTPDQSQPVTSGRISGPRRFVAAFLGLLLIATIIITVLNFSGFKAFISGGSEAVDVSAEGARLYIGIMVAFAAELAGITLTYTWKRTENAGLKPTVVRQKLSKRTIAAVVMILLTIPVTIYAGSHFLGDRKYYFISLLIIAETMLPFALVFESRKPQARELVIIAVLCAIAVAGRAAFFMLPQFKPVIAVVIISGVAFGGEAGFLVGAMTGFISNFFFGQGPWTPWQMFSFGVIGFIAGILFQKGLIRRSPASLAVFGALATLIVYGLIMDTSMVVLYQSSINRIMLTAAFLQGVPFNLVHAAATMAFLAIISRPLLEKLDRIKVKYGLVE